MVFIVTNLVFIDSMQFVNSSLDKLVMNLDNFNYLSEEFSGEQLKLLKRKGVYCYEHMDSFKKFNETELPDKSKFFSPLKDCGISDKKYERTVNVWKVFKIKNLGDYHGLYLKADVLFLCNVFEKFIKMCLDYYGLDFCHILVVLD